MSDVQKKIGLKETREVGVPYTMEGVYADDIRDYIHSNADA